MSALILPKFLLKYSKWMDVKTFKKVELQNKWIKNNSETYFLKENLNWIEYKNGVKIDSYEEIPTEFNYVLMYSEKTKIYNILTSTDLFSGKNLQNMKFIDEGKWDQTKESLIFVENEKVKNKWLKLDGGNSYYIKENYSWIEKYENGGIAGIFEEIYSDPNYLILFDSKRNFFVKLTDDVAYWGINDKIMFYLSDGKWKEKELESEEINSFSIKNQIDSIRQSLEELLVNSEQPNISSTHKLRTTNEENFITEKLSPENSAISIEQDQNNSEKFKTHIQETIQQPLDTKQTILTRHADNIKNKEENQNFEILNAKFEPDFLKNSVISIRQDQDNLEKFKTDMIEEKIQRPLDTEQTLLTAYNVDSNNNKEEIQNFEILNAKFESNNFDSKNEKLEKSIDNKRESVLGNQDTVVDNFIDHQYNIDSQYIDHLKKITANIDNDIESIISNRISIDNILNKFENNKINLEEEIIKSEINKTQSKQAFNIEEDIAPAKNNSNSKNKKSNCSLKIKAQNNSKYVNLKKITVNSDYSLDEFDLKNNQENINITNNNNKPEGNCSKESIDIKVTLNFNVV
jgi:hypothetical protein